MHRARRILDRICNYSESYILHRLVSQMRARSQSREVICRKHNQSPASSPERISLKEAIDGNVSNQSDIFWLPHLGGCKPVASQVRRIYKASQICSDDSLNRWMQQMREKCYLDLRQLLGGYSTPSIPASPGGRSGFVPNAE